MNEQENLKFNFESTTSKINPSENLLFAGIIVKATVEDIDQIKEFILKRTNARIIYQHRDIRYLKLVPATVTE